MTRRRQAPEGPLLTLSAAAPIVGFQAGRQLRRYVLARELATEQEILVRVGRGRRRPTYKVSLVRLRESCPELFDDGPDLVAAIKGIHACLERMQSKLATVDEVREAFAELDARVGALAASTRRRG